jgi:hypothetical protein
LNLSLTLYMRIGWNRRTEIQKVFEHRPPPPRKVQGLQHI